MDVENLDLADPMSVLSMFSVWALVAAFVFGVIGLYLFLNGKKRLNYWFIWIGVVLMVYPIFVSQAWVSWVFGSACCALAYFKRNE